MAAKKVLLMMSGGVDSSVSAAFLMEQGYTIIGLTLDQYPDPQGKEDNTISSDIADAQTVARQLGFEHHILNRKDRYQETVISNFVESYKNGLTPNPCVHCNTYVKFEEGYTFAREFGCDYYATGHYARLIHEENGEYGLYRAVYKERDQSYFLYGIRKELMPYILFPLGEKNKDKVREYARQLGLKKMAEKTDSQDICFAKNSTYNEFLSQYVKPEPGPMIDKQGHRLGTHTGVINYTVGQRKGIGLSGGPYYVCAIDVEHNTVIVGKKEDLAQKTVLAKTPRWCCIPKTGDRIWAQIRSRHIPSPAIITDIDENGFQIQFEETQYGVAPGQALVLSAGDKIIGGGIILPL